MRHQIKQKLTQPKQYNNLPNDFKFCEIPLTPLLLIMIEAQQRHFERAITM